ncbi:MAG: LacI family DNA-binding transcriptional regulator [Tepidisphaeraceae bacterium]
MRPTLIDIAKQTNTSVSTVSRVLTGGRVAQHVSDETKGRVLAAAKAMGYRPNLVARGLRTRRSGAVALLVSDIANPWFARLASLVEQSLHRRGYSLILCNSGEDPDIEAEYLNLLPQKGVDGLIIVPLLRTKKALHEFISPDMPLVVLDRPIPGISATVSSDEEQLAGLLCDTLGRALVRRVAIVSGPHSVITHRRRTELVSKCFNVVAVHEGPAQPETGRQAFIKFIAGEESMEPPLDAIVCTNNFLGQGVIDAIAMLEKPPVIACFDEIPMMHLLPLPIACSMQDVPMLAEACVSQLMPQLERDTVTKIQPVLLPARAVTNRAFQMRLFGQDVVAR